MPSPALLPRHRGMEASHWLLEVAGLHSLDPVLRAAGSRRMCRVPAQLVREFGAAVSAGVSRRTADIQVLNVILLSCVSIGPKCQVVGDALRL